MKIIKSVDKKVGEVTYHKYKINLPKKIVEEAKFEDKDLEVTYDNGTILIKKAKK